MRFALFYNFDIVDGKPVPELYEEIEAQALLAEQLGFDAIYLAEHHFEIYGRMPAPLLFLARLSALTTRLGLGTAVVEAPHYHPLRLAEDAALVDLLSGGRLRLGVGSGARNKPAEFARFGIPIDEKHTRTLEIVEILRQAFDTGSIHFQGRYYHYDRIEINPRPIQSADRLLWLAAGDSTVDLAGAHGYRLQIPRVGSAERHAQLTQRYRAALGSRPGFITQLRFVYVAETEREAKEQTRATFARYARYDCSVAWDGNTESAEYVDLARRMNMVIGTPDQVSERLLAWQAESGFDEIMCQVYAAGMRHADALRSIALLGRVVLPQLQARAT
ncbi:MAG TPA: LLM class flavin-dependent oxidoreductase [Roseiflexaceae bacterium]|nr:LLM class flavin-dependent oxidoreductase [Roseiflexaceae bacterium]